VYCHLLEIQLSLQILGENDEKLELRKQQLFLGDASAWEQSWKNIAIIKNSAFWHGLARLPVCINMEWHSLTSSLTWSPQNQKLS
jgi:hypothetical protein